MYKQKFSKKAKLSLFINDGSSEREPKNVPVKQNVFTPCRRIGLNRKKNKSLNLSPVNVKTNKNLFVEEDLQKINHTNVLPDENEVVEENKTEHKNQIEKPVENKIKKQRKRKFENDKNEIQLKKSVEDKIKINESDKVEDIENNSSNSDITNGNSSLSVIKTNQEDKEKFLYNNQIINTIPVSINLTRCDLDVLKLKLASPEKNKSNIKQTNLSVNDLEEVNENAKIKKGRENKKQLNTIENNNDKLLEKSSQTILDKTSVLNSTNILSENNSLENNSDDSDFYSNVTHRRKKKKILTNKQRSISKPSPSVQKQNHSLERRTSLNNTPYYSDSEDDFVDTSSRRDRKNSVKSENSQNLLKEENGKNVKKKIKLQKSFGNELNKTDHFRISENKSYTIIHRENSVSYVKSHDNDVNFKVTESDDNQQIPTKNTDSVPKKSIIIERKDYLSKKDDNSSENVKLISEMPSIFTDIMNNLDNIPVESHSTTKENSQQNKKTDKSQEIDQDVTETENCVSSAENKTQPDETSESNSESENSEINISENSESADSDSSTYNFSSLNEMTEAQLEEEVATLEANVKKKQERLQSLKRISVYKQTHNLDQLREITLQIKRGCQNALIDLVVNVKQQSNADFTMATLLEYMKIPNELVGYNDKNDSFT